MPPKSAQKRHVADEAGPSTKRTRFTENPVQSSQIPTTQFLEEDVDDGLVGDAFSNKVLEELEASGKGRKKSRVKTDGYESDSTDDGEGVVESRKKGRKKGGGDDDDEMDMFGGGEEVDGSQDDEPSAKKKETKYMSLGDIEGQEFGADQGGDADDDEEPEDEDDAIRKAKKGMGYELSSFNMKDEMEEGKFDEDGTFVRSFDPHQVHDRWMEGMDDSEIKKARRSRKKMEEREEARKQRQEDEERLAGRSKEQLEMELLDWVRPGESLLQTLARLGKDKKNREEKPKKKLKGRPAAAEDEEFDPGAAHPNQDPQTSAIHRVTSLASALMAMGNLDVYDETHRTLLVSVRGAGLVPDDWIPPSAAPPQSSSSSSKYQYRWAPEYLASTSGGAQPGEIFGPYGKGELLAWRDAAYFGPSGERVQVRREGEERWSDWTVVT